MKQSCVANTLKNVYFHLLKGRVTENEGESEQEKALLSAGSLAECLQQLGLARLEAGAESSIRVSPAGGRGKALELYSAAS